MNTLKNFDPLPMLHNAERTSRPATDWFNDYCRTLIDWEEPLEVLQKLVNPDDGELVD